ncbi:hypothetical protein BPAE_1062g00010 [Botrytis paeoniae]|uniref:Carboxylic ester hydrolase n=1 Tax=Botrytis paeoniae TaxID=278948 RepID=A0A4Z1EHZ6_9HELO|nr:hypothetical protein BPAE_1062g00010 [Botrytis paeoniae]
MYNTAKLDLVATAASFASAASLSSVCTTEHVQAAIPTSSDDIPDGITFNSSSLTTTLFSNYTVSGLTFWPEIVTSFCEASIAYSHENLDDQIVVSYFLPSPDTFQNRFVATGGSAYKITRDQPPAPLTRIQNTPYTTLITANV